MTSNRVELWSIRGSPWSLRVNWAMACLPEVVFSSIDFKVSTTGARGLSSKVNAAKSHSGEDESSKTLSLPMLFYKDESGETRVIREGVEIVEFLCQRCPAEERNDFVGCFLENTSAMREWNQRGDMLQRFFRARLIDAEEKDDFINYLLPVIVTWIPFLPGFISRTIAKQLEAKYYEEDKKITFEDMELILTKSNALFKKQPNLLGDSFSFADVCLFTALESILPTKANPVVSFTALCPNAVKAAAKYEWTAKFPDVFKARTKAMEKHFSEKAVGITRIPLNRAPEVNVTTLY